MTMATDAASDMNGFDGYQVQTKDTPTAFLAVVGVIVASSFLYITFYVFCLPSWKKYYTDVRQGNAAGHGGGGVDGEVPSSDGTTPGTLSDTENRTSSAANATVVADGQPPARGEETVSLLLPQPDTQPAPLSPFGISAAANNNSSAVNGNHSTNIHHHHPNDNNNSPRRHSPGNSRRPTNNSLLSANTGVQSRLTATNDRASAVPSTTTSTTSLRMRRVSSDRPLRSWDLSTSMRWKHRGTLRRVDSIQRSIQNERQAAWRSSSEDGGSAAAGSRVSRSSWNSRTSRMQHHHHHYGMSDVASSILDQSTVEGEAQFYRQRYVERNRRRRRPLSSSGSVRSLMPPLSPDAVSPEEAADAHDPGTLNQGYMDDDEYYGRGDAFTSVCGSCCAPVGNLLDYSDLDFETRRIVTLAFPATIEAAADPFFRMGVVALLSHFLDADSMVAFLLVSLLVRTSVEELSGAVADAQSTLIQEALAQGGNIGFNLAGRFVQLGMWMQLIFVGPTLALWAYFMEDICSWLVSENPDIAQVASDYARIIVMEFGIKAITRSFMLVFHLQGQAQFELNVDLSMTALTIATISIACSASDDVSLTTIAWIQVAIAAFTAIGKVSYMIRRGLLKPYEEGLFGGLALLDQHKVKIYLLMTMPLLLGSIVELGEWEILIFFVQNLGGAEVAAWAMMGIIWDVMEAFTEGLGEASAVRVSYYLSENLPDMAEQLAHKAVFLSIMESTILTAIFLMIGPNLSVALTRDAVLQHLFNDLVPMVALANMTMSLAQIYWSMVGAQGYFSRASAVILVHRWLLIIPLACALCYAAVYDLLSVAASIALGYATGGAILAHLIFQSDWTAVARQFGQDMMDGGGDPDLGMESVQDEEDYDEEESEDDSSTGFG